MKLPLIVLLAACSGCVAFVNANDGCPDIPCDASAGFVCNVSTHLCEKSTPNSSAGAGATGSSASSAASSSVSTVSSGSSGSSAASTTSGSSSAASSTNSVSSSSASSGASSSSGTSSSTSTTNSTLSSSSGGAASTSSTASSSTAGTSGSTGSTSSTGSSTGSSGSSGTTSCWMPADVLETDVVAAPRFIDSKALGDFTGRGLPDLVASFYPGILDVFAALDDGGYDVPLSFGVAHTQFATGDVNEDGIPDLVTPHPNFSVEIFFGGASGLIDSDGGLVQSVVVPVAASPGPPYVAAVGLADVDGDGHLDLVASDFSAALSVALGYGDGGFAMAQTLFSVAPLTNADYFRFGDLNLDGFADVAVTDNASNAVVLLYGQADGGFSSPFSYPIGARGDAEAIGDVTGDGIPDLIAGGQYPDQTVTLLMGLGDGGLNACCAPDGGCGTCATTPSGFNVSDIALGDANGDGQSDIIVSTLASVAQFAIVTADSSGNLTSYSYGTSRPESGYGVLYRADAGTESFVLFSYGNDGGSVIVETNEGCP